MKVEKFLFLPMTLAALVSGQAFANDYGFKKINFKGFGAAVLAPNGTVWSNYLGQYSNDGISKDGVITNSPAAKACEAIGGTLPTYGDYQSILGLFSGDLNDIRLSIPQLKDLHQVFPFFKNRSFWTSTVNQNGFPNENNGGAYDAYVFIDHYDNGIGDIQGNRLSPEEQAGVVCVGH